MRADSFELYLAAALALMVLAICFAGLLRFSIRHDATLSSLLLRRGRGINSTVATLDARYLLPWVSLPASSPLSGAPLILLWCARLSAWGAAAAVMAGLVISLAR
ncbi:MAG TPA: hypothetical protein VN156_00340 [Pseudomonas sp.]|nr:hypothetical protein [Pseudomonas sp.]